jgi:hypothetical protein
MFEITFVRSFDCGADANLQKTGLLKRRFYEKKDNDCIMQPVVFNKLLKFGTETRKLMASRRWLRWLLKRKKLAENYAFTPATQLVIICNQLHDHCAGQRPTGVEAE